MDDRPAAHQNSSGAPISPSDLGRYHAAARVIEADAAEAYWTARERYGADLAGALLVAYLRRGLGGDRWPPAADLVEEVNRVLRDAGLA